MPHSQSVLSLYAAARKSYLSAVLPKNETYCAHCNKEFPDETMNAHVENCIRDPENGVDDDFCLKGSGRIRDQTNHDLSLLLNLGDTPSKSAGLLMRTATRVLLNDELLFKEEVQYISDDLLDIATLKKCRKALEQIHDQHKDTLTQKECIGLSKAELMLAYIIDTIKEPGFKTQVPPPDQEDVDMHNAKKLAKKLYLDKVADFDYSDDVAALAKLQEAYGASHTR